LRENEVSGSPRQIADSVVVQHGAECTTVFLSRLEQLLFLDEKSGQSIFFCKLCHMLGGELKEGL
jgi:hypothetical protein